MSTNELKDYLKRVYELEKSLYMQTYAYNTVNQQVQILRNPVNVNYQEYEIDMRDGKVGCILIPLGFVIGGLGGCVTTGFTSGLLMAIGWGILLGILFAVGAVVVQFLVRGSIYKSKCNEVDRINQKKYEEACALQSKYNEQADILQKQLTKINDNYLETKGILDTYYTKNIVYSKYRNFVAISSIYEYIDSGRCVCLEGHEGAYNIYENEVRMNLIITKLDDISRKLDEIIENQRWLYDAITECNERVRTLNDNMMKSLNRIEDNVEVSNYYNRISAQNTEFLKWISIQKC